MRPLPHVDPHVSMQFARMLECPVTERTGVGLLQFVDSQVDQNSVKPAMPQSLHLYGASGSELLSDIETCVYVDEPFLAAAVTTLTIHMGNVHDKEVIEDAGYNL